MVSTIVMRLPISCPGRSHPESLENWTQEGPQILDCDNMLALERFQNFSVLGDRTAESTDSGQVVDAPRRLSSDLRTPAISILYDSCLREATLR